MHTQLASTLQVYLDTFLATLREQGYSIFVILGHLPTSSSGDMGSGSGSWFTAAQASHWCLAWMHRRVIGVLPGCAECCDSSPHMSAACMLSASCHS